MSSIVEKEFAHVELVEWHYSNVLGNKWVKIMQESQHVIYLQQKFPIAGPRKNLNKKSTGTTLKS